MPRAKNGDQPLPVLIASATHATRDSRLEMPNPANPTPIDLNKQELYERAQALEIQRRSAMTKSELARAIRGAA